MTKRFFLLIIFFIFSNLQNSFADLLKPNIKYKPFDVVKIQLSALKSNDKPYANAGIKQTWEFAHPSNKKFTGPLSKFIKLINDKNYSVLLNHINHEIIEIYTSQIKFVYEVTILDEKKICLNIIGKLKSLKMAEI